MLPLAPLFGLRGLKGGSVPKNVKVAIRTRHTMAFETPRGELKQPAAISSLFKEEKREVGELLDVQVGVEIIVYISGMTRMMNELYQTAAVVYKTRPEAEIPLWISLCTCCELQNEGEEGRFCLR